MVTERKNRKVLGRRVRILEDVDNRFRVMGHPYARDSGLLSFFGITASDHNVHVIKRFAREFPRAMIGSDWYMADEINEMNRICTSVLVLKKCRNYDSDEMRAYFGQFKTLVRRMLRTSGVEYSVVEA